MDIREGVESVVTVSMSAEITLKELTGGGAQMFAARLRERLEEELKMILDVPWDRVGIAPQPEQRNVQAQAVDVVRGMTDDATS